MPTDESSRQPPPEPVDAPEEHHTLREILGEAAVEAEFETGKHEETVAEAKRHLLVRVARITGGAVLVILGIAMLALPGPGLVTIAAGLALMSADVPFANRLLHEVRSRLPADENGDLPKWMIPSMILGAVVFTGISVWWTFLR